MEKPYWYGRGDKRSSKQIPPHIAAYNNRLCNYMHYKIGEFEIFLYNKCVETLLITRIP